MLHFPRHSTIDGLETSASHDSCAPWRKRAHHERVRQQPAVSCCGPPSIKPCSRLFSFNMLVSLVLFSYGFCPLYRRKWFEVKQSVGVIGGRSQKSFFFVGCQVSFWSAITCCDGRNNVVLSLAIQF